MMWIRVIRCIALVTLLGVLAVAPQPAWATLPTPNQPILVVQDSSSADPYQNFVPELLTTEGLNGFQVAQLSDLTAAFLTNYDVVILPHLALTSAQATLFSNYVNAGGNLVGFRPDLQLANVFGVASLGTTLTEGWLKIDTTTAYGSGLDSSVMRFHGAADLYSLSGASSLATLYNSSTLATSSPAAAIYSFGAGKAILFSFDLTQSIVLMRQGNPAWAGYPNNHDGFNTMRASQMFMDQGSGKFWNDLGDGALNDVPQADIQLRLFSNALVVSNSAKRPLPKLWYFPNQNRALMLMTGDDHGYPVDDALSEISNVASFGGSFSYNLWYPFGTVSSDQVSSWLSAGYSMGVHFDDTAEADSSGVGGSAASWSGMQNVISNVLGSFATTYPGAPFPLTTRDHFLIWVSRNAAGNPDQTAQAKLFQNAGIQFDTSYSSFPNRWGYMNGSGLPMKFLDTTTGTVIPVLEQATQYEDDVQLAAGGYSLGWNVGTAQSHYQQSLSDSLTKYNTVVTWLFHPENWSNYQSYAQAALQYAQSNSIPMITTASWLQFWQGRVSTAVSMPSFTSNTLVFTAAGSPAGLTLLVPYASGANFVATVNVDAVSQNFTVAAYQGVMYASVVLTAGTHNISISYVAASRILGQISPSAAAASTTIQVQSGATTQDVSVAADGTYATTGSPAGTYTVTPSSPSYAFSPSSRSVTLAGSDVTNVNFTATNNVTGQTLFTTQTPAFTNSSDSTEYEMGTVFTADVPGQVTAIRFWKASNESGTHVGKIWSAAGQLLTSVTFSNETGSGWQQQALPTPLDISASTTYVVTVNTAGTFFVDTVSGLASQIVNGDLSSVVGNNALFGPAGQFPTGTFSNSNYFRDIVFLPGVSATLRSVTLNPSSVAEGTSSTGTVTLSNPAPAGGVVVTLASDSSAAAVPGSVTVLEGATSATFTISTTTVGATTTANILGSYNGFQSAALTIVHLTVSAISLNPSSLTGGSSSVGTVTLNFPAPQGGALVTLSDDNSSATVPGSVTVPEGAIGATFAITTSAVQSITAVTITGSYNGGAQTAALTINPPSISSVSLNPGSVTGGTSTTGTATLNGPAPSGGATIALSSDNAAATVGANVTIAAGATTANFTMNTSAVAAVTTTNLTGNYNGIQSASLTINAPVLSSVSMSPTSVTGGTSSTGTATLNGPAPSGGATVALSSDNVAGTVGASVTITAGATTANFTVSTTPVAAVTTANLTGNYNGIQSASLTINAPVLSSVSMSPTSVTGGTSSTGTATLNGPAPSGGATVALSSDNAAATVGANVTIAAGATTANFTMNTSAVAAVTTANLTGNYNGIQSASLTINAPVLSSVSMSPTSVTGGTSSTGTATLNGPAPSGGATVALSSDNAAATVGANVTITAGATTANFTVSTTPVAAVTTANLTGNYNGIQSASLTINAPVLSSVSMSPTSVTGGTSSTGTATLNGPAPSGGATVALSSDNAAATVGANVTIAAGATTANFTVSTTPVAAVTTANLTGNYNGIQSASLTINAPVLSSVSMSPTSVTGGTSSTGTATLNGPAPSGGATVALSSDNAAATVGANVTITAGATTANFTVNTSAVAAVTTANLTGNYNGIQSASLTINAPVLSSVSMSPTSVTGGTSSTGTATLNGPAPSGGATVALSSDNAAATVGANVTITAGATTANFTVSTIPVAAVTTANLTGNYNGPRGAALTINPPVVSSVSLNPASVTGTSSSTGTVTLGSAAPAGGVVVTLSSDNPAATVPADVTVAAGATSATFSIDTFAVNAVTSADITATYNGTQSATLSVNPAILSSVSLNPGSLIGGSSSTGTVTLNAPAGSAGAIVTLSSDSAAATVSASVTVAAGATAATFTINTTAVATVTSAHIAGNFNGPQSTALTINPSALSSMSLNPATLLGGSSSIGTLTLNGPAPSGGALVTLSSGNAVATVPATVTVASGNTTANFTVSTVGVGVITSLTISGNFNGIAGSVLTINPAVLSNVTLNPISLTGGFASVGTVTLSGPAPPGGAVVALSSDNAVATVPPSVTVTGGATAATFSVNTTPILASTSANISATYLGTLTAGLTVNSAILSTLSLNPAEIAGGSSSVGTVTLSGPAVAGGVAVTLSSDTLPAVSGVVGVYTAAGLPSGGSVDWSSLGPAFTSVTSGATLPVNGLAGSNVTLSSATGLPMETLTNCNSGEDCGWYGNFAEGASLLWMNGTYFADTGWWAPNGPLAVQFDTPQRGIGFQVMGDEVDPFTATLCAYNSAGTLLGCVPVSGTGTGTADNSAIFTGLYDDVPEIFKVTIDVGGLLYPHDFAIGQMFVINGRKQMVPASVMVPAGAMTAAFPVNTSALTSTTSVNITANYFGTQAAALTIDPAALSTVTLNPSAVPGGTSLIGTATLTGAAPMGGAVVTLSADNPVSTGIQFVTSPSAIPQDGSVSWTDLGPSFTAIPSGTVVPITGLNGSTVTVSAAAGSSMVLTNCPAMANCGWVGNFVPAAPLLWVGGNYDDNGNWVGNGPLTLTLNTPQRGVGFRIMADEGGTFTGNVCAYNAANTLLGCVPVTGFGIPIAGGINSLAVYVGAYDDTAEISKVTVDAGGQLYPHDFAIGALSVAASRRIVPSTVTVQAGAATATFPVNTDAVNTTEMVNITGNYVNAHAGALTINPPMLSSVSLSPSSLTGSTSSTGTVTLATPAPGGGAVVSLSSNNAAATVPANVAVPADATTATFTITTTAVATAGSATISATYAGANKTASLSIAAPALASLSMNPVSIIGGTSSTGTVTLSAPAPVGGIIVTLSGNSASATVPANVTVAAGATTATFNVTTVAVGAVTAATITGTLNGVQTATLTINPALLSSASVNPTNVVGGTSSTGTVTLSSAAPVGGTVVTLSDDNASAAVPANVTVAAGATTATFTVTTVAVGINTPVTITASLAGTMRTATLTINAPVLSNLTMNPTSVTGGGSSTGTVTLSSAAPTGGASVTLSGNSSSATVPASVTVAAGATTATFTVTTTGVSTVTTVTVTGNYNGTRTATVTINPPVLSNLTLSPTTVVGGKTSTGTVTLGSVAPTGGAAVTLSSNNAAATVPASVTVAAGATTATFTVTTGGVSASTSATITGTYNGTRTATLTITPAALSTVTMSPTAVTGGVSSTGTVTLTGFAPAAGVTVALSSNNANARTPASVTVAAGSATATFTVTTVPVSAVTTATISAVYNGVTKTATLTINLPTLASVTLSPATVTGGNPTTGTVTLDSPAVTGGAVVALSDNINGVNEPASLTVLAGSTSANFTVTTSSVGATTSGTVTAKLNGVTKTATLTLSPPQVASITLNPTTVLGGVANSTATVTLNAPAAGNATQRQVALSSSNTAAATVPATVTVASGATTATFTVTSKLVLATTTSTISATMNGGTQTAVLTVNP